ncbi:hypothetical protein GCM10010412_078150 [Nonomuraea recticatena]|uniref:Uncharacterized protein n=1 Tax=Nonomuraea recticatena TaxID=46178 RepID=A0ABP6FFZ9_9ACTN
MSAKTVRQKINSPGRFGDEPLAGDADGQWHLYGPEGEIGVGGFGLFGPIARPLLIV